MQATSGTDVGTRQGTLVQVFQESNVNLPVVTCRKLASRRERPAKANMSSTVPRACGLVPLSAPCPVSHPSSPVTPTASRNGLPREPLLE